MLPKMDKKKLFTIIYADILIFANANVAIISVRLLVIVRLPIKLRDFCYTC